jgi:hypothetical protein
MENAIKWILENYMTLLTGILALIGALKVLAMLTPTKKDDVVLEKAEGIVAKIIAFLKK